MHVEFLGPKFKPPSPWPRRLTIAMLGVALAWILLDLYIASQMPDRAFRRGKSGAMFVVTILVALHVLAFGVALFNPDSPLPGVLLFMTGLPRCCIGLAQLINAESPAAIVHVGIWFPAVWGVACAVVGIWYTRTEGRDD